MEYCRCPCIHNGTCHAAAACTAKQPSDWIGGPSEPTIAQLPSGVLLLLFRVTGRPCMSARSTDGGASWSVPRETPVWAVWPELLALPNGVLVATSGRPSIGLWHSGDGGEQWTFVNVAATHNALLPAAPQLRYTARLAGCASIFFPSCWNPALACAVETTSYTGLALLRGDTRNASLLLTYDRLADGWDGPPGPYGKADRVFAMRIHVAAV